MLFQNQGGKNRRRGKNENDNEKRELTFKEEGQEYAQVLKMLGNGRLEALCFDGEKRLAHIRGKLRKKVWINQGDIILLSLRDYQDEKGDVILKYSADEARSLKAYGELPESAKINETDTYVSLLFSLSVMWNFGEEDVGIGLTGAADMAMRVWMTMSSSTRTEIRVMTRRLISMIFEGGSWWVQSRVDRKEAAGGMLVVCAEVDRGESVHRVAYHETGMIGREVKETFDTEDFQQAFRFTVGISSIA